MAPSEEPAKSTATGKQAQIVYKPSAKWPGIRSTQPNQDFFLKPLKVLRLKQMRPAPTFPKASVFSGTTEVPTRTLIECDLPKDQCLFIHVASAYYSDPVTYTRYLKLARYKFTHVYCQTIYPPRINWLEPLTYSFFVSLIFIDSLFIQRTRVSSKFIESRRTTY